ncbi:BI1-like protein [Platanthera guangdongensis]|uniref:BI1-like protein n=1 Tax=Platanthera guangdongensis TaxID=2320717 RepID=A0ABR2LE89_9ASPA
MMEWNRPPYKGGDVEAGGGSRPLYPAMTESPELRWSFIRKIYTILSVQILLTVANSAIIISVKPIPHFFVSSGTGLGLYLFLLIFPFLVLIPLYFYHQRHPINLILLTLFTISLSFAVGVTCAFTKGKVILEAAILTGVVVISLTLYTFWAAKRGHDFTFLGPVLFSSIIVLLVFGLIQVFFPMGRISVMIYGGLGALVFSGYIIYDTDNLIKRYSYDEYIWAAVALYLDIINLFLSLLALFRAADG